MITGVDGGPFAAFGKVEPHGVEVFRRVRVFVQVPIGVKVLLQLEDAPNVDGDQGGRHDHHQDLDGRSQQKRAVESLEKEFEQVALGARGRLPGFRFRAEAAADPVALFAALVQHSQRHEEGHFQDEEHQNSGHGVDAKGSQGRHAGRGSDGERGDVSDGRDRNRHSGVFHSSSHPFRNRQLFLLYRQII